MVKDVGLKIIALRSLEWHYLLTKYLGNLPGGSKNYEWDTHTDRQTDW
jgi:hypothetical protein